MGTDFQSCIEKNARKPHWCDYCNSTIPAKTRYVAMAVKWEGDFHAGKGHIDCRALWNALYTDWAEPWEGMPWDICEVLTGCGDQAAVQASLNLHRGVLPHAVNRIEFRLRNWLEARK